MPSETLPAATPPAEKKEQGSTDANTTSKTKTKVRIFEQGVFTIWKHEGNWSQKIPGLDLWWNVKLIRDSLPYLKRYVAEVYNQGPLLFWICMAAKALEHFTPTLNLWQSSLMLTMVSFRIASSEQSI